LNDTLVAHEFDVDPDSAAAMTRKTAADSTIDRGRAAATFGTKSAELAVPRGVHEWNYALQTAGDATAAVNEGTAR
jgi:hypothetical protein